VGRATRRVPGVATCGATRLVATGVLLAPVFVLVVAAAEVLPTVWAQALLAVALVLLIESFGHQVVMLRRHRHDREAPRSPLVRPVLDGVALVLVWLALVLPQRPDQLTAAALLALPVELLVFLLLVLVLPRTWGRVVAVAGGVLLAVAVVVTVLDLGFYEAFDRPFNPLTDPGYLGSGLDLLHASVGRGGEVVALVGIAMLLLGGAALCLWSAVRTRRTVRAAPRVWSRAIAGLAVVWLVAGVGGAEVSGVQVAGTPTASLVASQVDQVRAELHDRAVFEQAVTHDAYALTPGRDLLTRLRGKDVLLVFVESYGRVAVEDSWFAPQVDRTLTAATAHLGRLGFRARSGWLGSPTFGGISWLAHSTLQTGLWIDSEQRYDQVLGTDPSPWPGRSARRDGAPSTTSPPTGTPGRRDSGSTTTTGCTAPTTSGTTAHAWATPGSPTSTRCDASTTSSCVRTTGR